MRCGRVVFKIGRGRGGGDAVLVFAAEKTIGFRGAAKLGRFVA